MQSKADNHKLTAKAYHQKGMTSGKIRSTAVMLQKTAMVRMTAGYHGLLPLAEHNVGEKRFFRRAFRVLPMNVH